MNQLWISDHHLLILIFVAFVVGVFFVFLLLWATISFVRSHRRIAESVERLNQSLQVALEPKETEKEWKLEEFSKPPGQAP